MKELEYAVYKGDDLLGIGTAAELAEKLNVRPQTIRYWSCPSYYEKGAGGRKIAILLDDDDDDQ